MGEVTKLKLINIRGYNSETSTVTTEGSTIKFGNVEDADDGYHTFEDLYEHRHQLFLALCKILYRFTASKDDLAPWMSNLHHDGTMFDGWFIAGIGKKPGEMITYHLPVKYWEEAKHWCIYLPHAPEWDGHTSKDVLERLRKL